MVNSLTEPHATGFVIGDPDSLVAKAPRGLNRMLIRLLMRPATIVAAETIGKGFRLITFEGEALRGIDWRPGQKIQIMMGSAFTARTYTPMEWNAVAGRMCILAYGHGDGPGSRWVQQVAPGHSCDLFGPRSSLDTRALAGPLALFGDETSIGLAYALSYQDPDRPVSCHIEAADPREAWQTMAAVGLRDPALFERQAQDGHLAEMVAALPALARAGASFVLTGKAGTVRHLRRALKRHAVSSARIAARTYWAPGKTGLD